MLPDDFPILIEIVNQKIIPRFSAEHKAQMAELYRNNHSLNTIAQRFLQDGDDHATVETAVRLIVIEILGREEYGKLAGNKGKGGKSQFISGTGIHSEKFNKGAAGAKGALAIGRETWNEDEKDFIVSLANQPEYRRGGGVSAAKILLAFNEKFPERPERSPKAMSKIIERLKDAGQIEDNVGVGVVEK